MCRYFTYTQGNYNSMIETTEPIETLLSQLTLEEKVSLAAGATFWTTVSVERAGIPAIKVTDGPNGARGGSWNGEFPSASFPVGISLAATWNTEQIRRIGAALADETRSKGAVVLLGPTVNIHRSPLNGRNFECYSEDPYLTARMATAYITGLQGEGISACVKHFVCNDSEFERQSISSEVGERALHEIYLPPFEAAVKEAGTWSLMSSYNRINGVFAAENTATLRDILKGEWGFDGLVMSDWFGTKSTVESANAGLDLEMPGPAQFMGEKLLEAVNAGLVSETVIDDKVRRLLRLMERVGALQNPGIPPEQANNRPEHRQLLREVAAESLVLLKNERALLPLEPSKVEKLAIIGPAAKSALIQGGGSAQVTPHYAVTPFQGVMNAAGQSLEIAYEIGCTSYKAVPLIDISTVRARQGSNENGLLVEFFDNSYLAGAPVFTRVYHTPRILWMDDIAPGVHPHQFSARLSGWYTAEVTGDYTFSLVSAGVAKLFVDGKEVIDNWTAQQQGEEFFGAGSTEVTGHVPLVAGQTYALHIDYSSQNTRLLAAVRLGCLLPTPDDMLERAVRLAADSDVAVVFAGLGAEWESEGYDRPTMDLPPEQDELIAQVAAVNPNTVVVLNVGSPIRMPWLDKVAAVLVAWYSGQESGNAVADVLFGQTSPSGKLPQTFPKRLEDNPAYINYPGENGKVFYGENIFVGYRYYEKKKVEPLFPFGHGLSYTSFAYDNLKVGAPSYDVPENIRVMVDVTNTGNRAGQEVVQLYVRDAAARLSRPEKELKGFAKVSLQPGQMQTVEFVLNQRSLSYYDPANCGWVAEAGMFEVLVGSSSADIRQTTQFELTKTVVEQTSSPAPLTIQNSLSELIADERAKTILESYLPGIYDDPQFHAALNFSLEQVANFVPDKITPETLEAINSALAENEN